jgi:predicted ATPase
VALTNIWLRDVDRVQTVAREALQLAEKMSLALWQAWGRIQLGWALAERARPEALAELEAGLEEASQIGARRLEPFHLGLVADVRSCAGQHDAAKATFAAAFVSLASTGDIPFAADLHRLRALAALRASAVSTEEAIADLQRALEIARQQGARSLELRAARDLARVWAERSERQKAYDLLAPVYDWFTEGFDTADLKDAKALLDQLQWAGARGSNGGDRDRRRWSRLLPAATAPQLLVTSRQNTRSKLGPEMKPLTFARKADCSTPWNMNT